MKVLLASYYAERHLSASSAQNTRRVATALAEDGHDVHVVCASHRATSKQDEGFRLTTLPLTSPSWKSPWLGPWRPDRRIADAARRELSAWHPDVALVGAFNGLTELGLEVRRRGIPVVQIVHDYSLICLRQWLLDSSGNLCDGPSSQGKCHRCVAGTLGFRAGLVDRMLSLPLLPRVTDALLGPAFRGDRHVATAVGDAWGHMAAYRQAITLYIAQAPSVVELLGSAGIEAERCRFLPQFIGDEMLESYPRPTEPAGEGRPLRVAYVGRWSREKGPDILLDAFRAAEAPIEMELRILSRNADAGALERDGRRRVRVVNDAWGAEVSRQLAQCDLCVVPSRCRELASRIVLEANAQGVPVAASSTVGNGYLIEDGVNGRIFTAGSVEALRDCLEEVAARPAMVRDWSTKVAKPVRREAWRARVTEILEEAVSMT